MAASLINSKRKEAILLFIYMCILIINNLSCEIFSLAFAACRLHSENIWVSRLVTPSGVGTQFLYILFDEKNTLTQQAVNSLLND